MGIWSFITGAKSIDKTLEIADKTTTGIISGLDKMFFTKEEKAEMLIKKLEIAERMSKTHIELMKVTHDENTTRSMTRRVIAISIMFFTLLLMIGIIILYKVDPEWSSFSLKVVEYFQFGWAFMSVVVFFFGNHIITRMKK